MIRRLLLGSLRRRAGQLALIAVAATVAAATVTAAAGLGARLAAGISAGLHAAGPNLLVRPQVGGPPSLPAAEVEAVAAVPGVELAAGIAEEAAGARRTASGVELTAPGEGDLPVVAATGGLFALHPAWEIDGRRTGSPSGSPAGSPAGSPTGAWALAPGEALVGQGAAGRAVDSVAGGGRGVVLRAVGTLATGEAPDRGVVVRLADLARARGAAPAVGRIEVRAAPGRLEATVRAIEARLPGVEARPLARVTATDARVTRNLQLLMAGIGAICLLLAFVTVGSATLALLEERRREMALFLALGYTGRWVQGLVSAELGLVGLASVVAGGLLGEAAAALLARVLLGGEIAFRPSLAGLVAGCLAVALVVIAAALLVRRRVERLDAAVVLQGN